MISLVIIIVYLVMLFTACAIAKKREEKKVAQGGKGSFLMAGKDLPFVLIVFMMAGNIIGGSSTTGAAELAMTAGFSAVWYGWAAVFGVIILAFVGAKRMRILEYNTVSEMVSDYCGSVPRLLMCIGTLFAVLGVCALQYYAGGTYLASMFPDVISVNMGMIITAAAFLLICIFGGLLGASIANLINVVVIIISLLVCLAVLIINQGGWEVFATQVANIAEPTDNGGSWWSIMGGVGIATAMSYMASEPGNRMSAQSNTMMAFAARSPKEGKWGIFLGALILIPITIVCVLFGLYCRVYFPETSPSLAMGTVLVALPSVLAGIGLAGLWAVIVSSGVALLMAAVQMVEFDILALFRKNKPERTAKQEKISSRIVMIVLTVLTLSAAFMIRSIVSALITILCITPALFMMVLAILYFPNLIKKSTAYVVIGASYLFFILWAAVPAISAAIPTAIYFEWPMAIVLFFGCAVLDKRKVAIPERRAQAFAAYKVVEDEEKAAKEAVRHQRWLKRVERQVKACRSVTVKI